MTRNQTEAIAELAAILCGKDSHAVAPHRARAIAMQVYAIGRRMHRLCERVCSDPSLSEQAYNRRFARLTKSMRECVLGCLVVVDYGKANGAKQLPRMGTWEWQTDPRGWPVIVKAVVAGNTYEIRVGGP